MKKIMLIAAMAFLTISGFAQQGVIGTVSYDELIYLMPEYMEAQVTLAAVNKETSETYQAMVEEYQSKMTQYQQKSSNWTAAIKDAKEKELMDMQNRIQEFQQSAYQELQEKQSELIAPIREKAIQAVKDHAKAMGLILVLDVNQLLYFDESKTYDLMPAVRNSLGIPEGRTLERVQEEISVLQQQYAE